MCPSITCAGIFELIERRLCVYLDNWEYVCVDALDEKKKNVFGGFIIVFLRLTSGFERQPAIGEFIKL